MTLLKKKKAPVKKSAVVKKKEVKTDEDLPLPPSPKKVDTSATFQEFLKKYKAKVGKPGRNFLQEARKAYDGS
jgi:hypothetical protein